MRHFEKSIVSCFDQILGGSIFSGDVRKGFVERDLIPLSHSEERKESIKEISMSMNATVVNKVTSVRNKCTDFDTGFTNVIPGLVKSYAFESGRETVEEFGNLSSYISEMRNQDIARTYSETVSFISVVRMFNILFKDEIDCPDLLHSLDVYEGLMQNEYEIFKNSTRNDKSSKSLKDIINSMRETKKLENLVFALTVLMAGLSTIGICISIFDFLIKEPSTS